MSADLGPKSRETRGERPSGEGFGSFPEGSVRARGLARLVPMSRAPHVLIVGGGYVGLYTAYRLQRKLRAEQAAITVVDPRPNMTYQPFLPEAAAGSIEPRHVVVPLRKTLRGCRVLTGQVSTVDHARRVATVIPAEGVPVELAYDVLVMAAGSVAQTQP